ncbi:MAG TPA: hypothetical protein VIV12_22735 [Streptosporangiaceae bacterium]
MGFWRKAGSIVRFGAVSLLVIGLAPAVVLAGELVNRHYLMGLRARPDPVLPPRLRLRCQPRAARRRRLTRYSGSEFVDASFATGHGGLGRVVAPFLANPVWIALTAPARWIITLARRRVKPNGRGGRRPPFAGVREPRRPKPTLPAGAIALPEPRWPES